MDYKDFKNILACPDCRGAVSESNNGFNCIGDCKASYPIYHNVPVLISPKNPVFTIEDFADGQPPAIFFNAYNNPILQFFKKIRPDVTLNIVSKKKLCKNRKPVTSHRK